MKRLPSFLAVLCIALASPADAGTGVAKRRVSVTLSAAAVDAMARIVAQSPNRRVGSIEPTGSMRPTLDERHIVVVERRDYSELAKGQIALFTGSWTRDVIAHRLVSRAEHAWQTKGDNLSITDPYPMTIKTFSGFVVIAAIDKQTGDVRQM